MEYHLNPPPELAKNDVFHASLLKPQHGPVISRPALIIVTDVDAAEYVVEAVLCHCTQKYNHTMKAEYLVKWKGYPLHEVTWEPCENLDIVYNILYEYQLMHGLITL